MEGKWFRGLAQTSSLYKQGFRCSCTPTVFEDGSVESPPYTFTSPTTGDIGCMVCAHVDASLHSRVENGRGWAGGKAEDSVVMVDAGNLDTGKQR